MNPFNKDKNEKTKIPGDKAPEKKGVETPSPKFHAISEWLCLYSCSSLLRIS